VLALREKNPALKLHCILPCVGQDGKWPAMARVRYASILDKADSVYVSRGYHPGCMLERDRFLVDWSNCLLAVYNGEGRGGTAATIDYARQAGQEIWVIDSRACGDIKVMRGRTGIGPPCFCARRPAFDEARRMV